MSHVPHSGVENLLGNGTQVVCLAKSLRQNNIEGVEACVLFFLGCFRTESLEMSEVVRQGNCEVSGAPDTGEGDIQLPVCKAASHEADAHAFERL